jgi:hypothetical protein
VKLGSDLLLTVDRDLNEFFNADSDALIPVHRLFHSGNARLTVKWVTPIIMGAVKD